MNYWLSRFLETIPLLIGVSILTFLIWVCIIFLGRLIAYDHVWGSWSPSERQ